MVLTAIDSLNCSSKSYFLCRDVFTMLVVVIWWVISCRLLPKLRRRRPTSNVIKSSSREGEVFIPYINNVTRLFILF